MEISTALALRILRSGSAGLQWRYFNPAVTIGLGNHGQICTDLAPGYILAQFLRRYWGVD